MVFKRRDKPSLSQRIQEAVYPRKGWRRALEYLGHRIKRLPDTPHRVALGIACGMFVSFSPFFGFHFFLAVGAAMLVRANVFAALVGTFLGNPITFPFIAAVSLSTGRWILNLGERDTPHAQLIEAFGHFFSGIWATIQSIFGYGPGPFQGFGVFLEDVFLPYLVGGIGPGLAAATAVYLIFLPLIKAYQKRRQERMRKRIMQRMRARPNAQKDAKS